VGDELWRAAVPVAAGFVLFGLGALPAGWLGDRWSAEHMMFCDVVGSTALSTRFDAQAAE